MKRALLFLLLGPVLCVALLAAPPAIHSPTAFLPIFVDLAPIMFASAVGLMVIAGAVDWLLSGRTWIRIIASASAAYAAVMIFQYATDTIAPLIGLVGAIPAALCSWLVTKQEERM